MIDWFASKLGVLIFVTAAAGAVLVFVLMQLNLLEEAERVQAANDVARLMDSATEGSSMTYDFKENRTLQLDGHRLVLEGVERWFLSEAEPASLNARLIIIEGIGGKVRVGGI